MNRETFIDKIKTLFSEVEENVEDKFVDVTTIDGIVLRVKEEEIKEGVQVYVVGEEGEETPAPEGEHNIEGKVITTDAEGKIVSIKDVDEETEATEEEKKEEVIEEEMADEKKKKDEDEDVEAEDEEDKKKEDEDVEAGDKDKKKKKKDIYEDEEEENPLEKRIESLEKAIANIAESMSAIDNLSEVVSQIANLPADEEVKLSKYSNDKTRKINSREEKLRFLSKRK
tara:strand:+ start:1375 stop:2055 length:681 start_codon:yes stop_codon:yes gene_type:complete